MDFHTADPSDVVAGRVTDVYFERAESTLLSRGIDRRVRAEFVAKSLPDGAHRAVLGGVQDLIRLAEEASLDVSVRAMPEGTVFGRSEPVLEIEGRYLDFGRFETAFLGLLCHASGVSTRAARCRVAAEGRPVFCFGARRVHPVLAPVVERWAWIGGADGVAATFSAARIGVAPSGTMPHSLVLLCGDTVEAARAFDSAMSAEVPRIVLVDTFGDERFEALRVAEALGPALAGVRLDTPASRRGDLLAILREIRWELDLRGFSEVRLVVSGGLDDRDLRRLNPAADAYGVGTFITSAPAVDFSMDIVEIDGRPASKRGKPSGSKSVVRCERCGAQRIVPRESAGRPCSCGGRATDWLETALDRGRRRVPADSVGEIRRRVLSEIESGRLMPPADAEVP